MHPNSPTESICSANNQRFLFAMDDRDHDHGPLMRYEYQTLLWLMTDNHKCRS